MKRIHLTPEDLVRVRVGAPLGAFAETMLATRVLQRPDAALFDGWRRQVRSAMPTDFGVLADIVPARDTFVDLITPTKGARSLEAGIEALHLASNREICRELACTVRHRAADGEAPLPTWTAGLLDRRANARASIAAAAVAFHNAAFAGRWAHVQSYLDATAERMARAMASEGVEGLFAMLRPHARWRTPWLEIRRTPYCHDEYPGGRGLLVVPSLFASPRPVLLMSTVDSATAPILVVPAARDLADLAAAWGPRPANEALVALLGRTRAAALEAVAAGRTTSELARELGVSPATASEHATILRESGLIDSHRRRNAVRHELTTLGAALLDGKVDEARRTA
ncbi:ArsR family transcriptional regulator [Nocardia panacis]|uniref:ArsR family transcriptional regulator n=1 Tax=Nocardia panacis TaxID=2340916 RepID=A0A3A4L4Y7_9NOCA|nr:winged helix-turn-helix domain-containing protein [Nocardia panacis]RJO77581.1 ArsR family transcriptional regulator [Nocardia panacis]